MNKPWQQFLVYSDAASAEVVAGLLRSESIPVRIAADEPVPGLAKSFRLMVPAGMVDKARGILAGAQLSDDELARAALGEPGADPPETPPRKKSE